MLIRAEQPGDQQRIHDVTVAAFKHAPHTDHNEQLIVAGLRDSGALAISLVAEVEGEIAAHVALSPVTISDGTDGWFGLGPISVAPAQQRKGVGSKLVLAAIEELNMLKAKGCVLLGDPVYYRRFGFEPHAGLELDGVPPEYFQAILLQGTLPQGSVAYHESFSAQS